MYMYVCVSARSQLPPQFLSYSGRLMTTNVAKDPLTQEVDASKGQAGKANKLPHIFSFS